MLDALSLAEEKWGFRVGGSRARSALTQRERYLLGALLALALVVRGWILSQSIGSNDAPTWQEFAGSIAQHGLLQTYRDIDYFNHPPLMGWFSWLALRLSAFLHVEFSAVFKAPVIVIDLASAWLLWLRWRERGEREASKVALLFAFNLVSILVSAYHGNTDCMFATLCLASALALSREQWGWAGLALGAAINVKIVPLMLLPVFVPMLPSRRALLRFGLGAAVCALPFVPVLRIWPTFYRNVFAYNSMPYEWGIPLLIQSTQQTLPRLATWLRLHYDPNARFVILGVMVLIGALQRWRRQLNAFEAGALGLSAFLVLSPGFGVQYLAWVVPLLFAAHPRAAFAYSAHGGLFAFLIYYLFWTGTHPWYSNFGDNFPSPSPFVGVLAWAALLSYCVACFRKLLAFNKPASVSDSSDTSPLPARSSQGATVFGTSTETDSGGIV